METQNVTTVDRLVALAKLWGDIEHFYVGLPKRGIEWDQALLTATPRVLGATSSDEFQDAVRLMLEGLDDPRVGFLSPSPVDLVKPSPHPSIEHSDGIAILKTGGGEPDVLRDLALQAAGYPRVVVDLRGLVHSETSIWSWLSPLVGGSIVFPSRRFRTHLGFASQVTGSVYSTGIQYEAGVQRQGEASGIPPQLCLVFDRWMSNQEVVASALQVAGNALAVTANSQEVGVVVDVADAGPVQFPLEDWVHADGTQGLSLDGVGADPVQVASDLLDGRRVPLGQPRGLAQPPPTFVTPSSQSDEPEYPAVGQRVLGVTKLWSWLHLFYGYPELVEAHSYQSWDELLENALKGAISSSSADEYFLALNGLMIATGDFHSLLTSPASRRTFAGHPPITVRFIEGETVVVAAGDEAGGVEPGDVVLMVDEEDIVARRARVAARQPAQDPKIANKRIHTWRLLCSPVEDPCVLRLRGKDGKERTASVKRLSYVATEWPRQLPTIATLAGGLGYMDLDRLPFHDVDQAVDGLMDTRGLILDMRGYPHETGWRLAARLATQEGVAARFRVPINSADSWRTGQRYWQQTDERVVPVGPTYLGKVVVLINEEALSQAEHLCLQLEAACNPTFIGTPTGGANGNVTEFSLPGGIRGKFAAMEVRHGDWRQLQGVGIQPHIIVEPTIAGVRAGKDEILDAAREYLLAQLRLSDPGPLREVLE